MSGAYDGRHVLVTGGAGALGAAVVHRLVGQGATCHVPVRRALAGAVFSGVPAHRLRVIEGVDVADEAAVRELFGTLPPGLWASIHVAGGFDCGPLADTTLGSFTSLWSTNATSCFLCCREALRVMRAAGTRGRIVNVASRPALEPRTGAGMAAYTMSKAAVAALTVALAEEVAGDGIWVNAVAPSLLDTPANRAAMPQADFSRWPRVEEVAETIVFLASPQNAATRGGLVPVYGRS